MAEQAFGAGVERFDAAVHVDDDDAIDGRVDDRPPPGFADAQALAELRSPREVVKHAGELALAANPHFPDQQMQRERGAIAPAPDDFAAVPDDFRLSSLEVPLDVPIVLLLLR